MPIFRLVENAFEPERVAVIASAYEGCLKAIGLVDRTDPFTEVVAKKIVEIARQGETDPHRMCERAMAELGIRPRQH